ncbi:MAG: hypothetical protein ACYCSX_10085 [Acidimicrobiales bacterium]
MPIYGKPSDQLVDHKAFGKDSEPQWWKPRTVAQGSPLASTSKMHDPPYRADDELSLALAYYQHRVVRMAMEVLNHRHRSRTDFAKWIGDDPDHVQRKFRGETWAAIHDYFAWARGLGVDILPNLDDWAKMLPNRVKERAEPGDGRGGK